METKLRIYYAHSKKIYNTLKEDAELNLIQHYFPEAEIIDPNTDMGELGSIQPYLSMIDTCDMVIFSSYNGYIGKGVYDEIEHATNRNIEVLYLHDTEIDLMNGHIHKYNVDDWKVKYAIIEYQPELQNY